MPCSRIRERIHCSAPARSSITPQATIVACFWSALKILVRLSIGVDTSTSVVCGLAFALRREQRLRLKHDDDAARHHHRQRPNGGHQFADTLRDLLAGGQISHVNPFHVEGAQPLLDDLLELHRQR